jgi:prevent-host-death family protein
MTATLRESKARLSELVERASRGEDVLITVRGKVKARLTRATRQLSAKERAAWVRELRRLQKRYAVYPLKDSTQWIMDEIREDIV